MDPEHLEILREAFEIRQRKEEFERAVGRAVRKRSLEFKVYIQIVDELREKARQNEIGLDVMARRLLYQQQEGPKKNDQQHNSNHEHKQR